ncbi:MAG: exodeoxyribonuclease VII small subunit [Chloroflexi bacterium]|nr:exodeoxyribonuclease VII small subunit [Chloroflexota bacterium]
MPRKPASPPAELPFEEAYSRLELAVQRLESGGLSLDEALSLYQEGMQLAGLCTHLLDNAELRVTQLSAFPDGDAAV